MVNPHCDGKVKYPSKAAALRRIDGQMSRHRLRKCDSWGKRQFQTYHCPCCSAWHVGGGVSMKVPMAKGEPEIDPALLAKMPEWALRKLGGGAL